MDQKDSNLHTKKLASASELRGKKSGMPSGKKGGRKMWLSLISLVVVLGLAVGVYFLSDVIKPEEEVTVQPTLRPSTTVKVVDRERAEVSGITVEVSGEEPYTILSVENVTGEGENAKVSYSYAIEGRDTFELDQSQASSMVGYAANMTATQQVAEGVTDFTPYGLDNPAVTVTMNYKDGSSAVWLFGKQVPAGSGRYICRKGTSTVFIIYTSAFDSLNTSLNDLYVLSMPVTFTDVNSLKGVIIEQKGKETLELRYADEINSTFSISSLKIVRPIQYDAQGERGMEMLEGCMLLNITGYAGEKSELPEAGLDDPRARITVEDTEGNVLNYVVGNYCGSDHVYVQVDDSETVYLADVSTLSFLNNANVGYVVDQFANLVNIQKVDELIITAGDKEYTMGIVREPELDENGVQKTNNSGKPTFIETFYFDGEETDEDLFRDLYQYIIGTMVSKVSDDYALDGEVIASVKYKLNVEPGEFMVEYLAYDDEYYAVRRDNLTLFLIKHEKVQDLITQAEAYSNGTFVPLD